MVSPTLPVELKFLERFTGDRSDEYRKAEWRTSAFDDDVWERTSGLSIDFRVTLDDGYLLTDARHNVLLETLKTWLCVQGHPDASGGQLLGRHSVHKRVGHTLHIIDYLLLNAGQLRLSTHGLSCVTANDLHRLAVRLHGSDSIAESVYDWPTRLEQFIRPRLQSLNQTDFEQILEAEPLLRSGMPPTEDRLLPLSDEEVLRARAWLFKHGYYESSRRKWRAYCSPDTVRISRELYENTLAGKTTKRCPDELRLNALPNHKREFSAVPIRDCSEDGMSELAFCEYMGCLRRLALLDQIGLPIPLAAIRDMGNPAALLEFRTLGRYHNLPRDIVLGALRQGIEFILEYGDGLVTSYIELARRATACKMTCRMYSNKHGISVVLNDKLATLGIRAWSINDLGVQRNSIPTEIGTHRSFQHLRNNVGLWELLQVLYGSIQVCVGALMARRQGELSDLMAGSCLDQSKTRLVFFNRKSGFGDMRAKEARPIPPIGVRAIQLLERLQSELLNLGVLRGLSHLFAFPNFSSNGLVTSNSYSYNQSLDYFCDYFEMPRNAKGERYYIRQHQLRRFFAMQFFWGHAYGGLETLRWFFCHTDVRHLYNYITESIPGTMLRSVKALYAAEQVRDHCAGAEALADLLFRHYGTRDFSVLDSEELTEYIEDLMIDGTVAIEPDFFEGADGSQYRVLIKVLFREGGTGDGR